MDWRCDSEVEHMLCKREAKFKPQSHQKERKGRKEGMKKQGKEERKEGLV
jgi:hypothetical protein